MYVILPNVSVFYFFYLMIFFILKVESGLRRWCEITARCGDVEFEISKDKIESFELRKPHIVLTDQWRIRKQLWMMLFAIQEFNKSISEKETTEDDSSFITNHSTLLHNKLYQTIMLCKNNNEPLYEAFYLFILVIMNLIQLVQLFNSKEDDELD